MKKSIIASLLAIFMVGNASAMPKEGVAPIFDNSDYTQLYFYTHSIEGANETYLNVAYSPEKELFVDFFGEEDEGKTITGDFNGDGNTDYAFVKVKGKNIRWRSKTVGTAVDFGGKKAKILTNCDFNGDGKTELVYVSGKTAFYRTMDNSSVSEINLPKKEYKYMICADVLGAGYTQIIAKKQLTKKIRRKTIKYWVTDIITRDGAGDGNTMKNIEFGGTTQGNIFALDINGDGIREVGFARKGGSNKTTVVFLDNLFSVTDGAKPTTTRFLFPRLAMSSNDAFEITPADLPNGPGFYLKNKNGFFSCTIADSNCTRIGKLSDIVSPEALDNKKDLSVAMAKLFLVKDSDFFSIASESAGDVQCDEWRGKGNGFLWKGKGEAYGGVSAGILPIYTKASTCQIVSNAGKTESMWCSDNSANPWGGVGRQHWRSRQTCGHYTKPSTLRCNVKGKWQCWKLANPCDRIE